MPSRLQTGVFAALAAALMAVGVGARDRPGRARCPARTSSHIIFIFVATSGVLSSNAHRIQNPAFRPRNPFDSLIERKNNLLLSSCRVYKGGLVVLS